MEITNIHSSKSTEHGYNNRLGDIIAVKTQKSSKSNGLIFREAPSALLCCSSFPFPKKLRRAEAAHFCSQRFLFFHISPLSAQDGGQQVEALPQKTNAQWSECIFHFIPALVAFLYSRLISFSSHAKAPKHDRPFPF